MNNPDSYRPQPPTTAGNGRLYRAVVSLPRHMTGQELQERFVFFEAHTDENIGPYLEELLAKVWCVDTKNWCEDGYIYNVNSARELHGYSCNDDAGPNDLMLFETGSGGTGIEAVGPNRTHYAQADDVDLFVTPRVSKRLREALDLIELMRVNEARRRKGQNR